MSVKKLKEDKSFDPIVAEIIKSRTERFGSNGTPIAIDIERTIEAVKHHVNPKIHGILPDDSENGMPPG
jgi:hypothetical protein